MLGLWMVPLEGAPVVSLLSYTWSVGAGRDFRGPNLDLLVVHRGWHSHGKSSGYPGALPDLFYVLPIFRVLARQTVVTGL